MATFNEMKENLTWIDTPQDAFAVVIAISYRQEYLDDLDEKQTESAWKEFTEQFIEGRNYQRMADDGAMIITSGFGISGQVEDAVVDQEHFVLAIPATLDFIAEINVKWRERLAYGVRFMIKSKDLLVYPTDVILDELDDNSPNSDNPDVILQKFDNVTRVFSSVAEQMFIAENERALEEQRQREEEEQRQREEEDAERNRPLTIEEQLELEQFERDDMKADLQEELTQNLLASFPVRELEYVEIESHYLDNVDSEHLSKNLSLIVEGLQKEIDQKVDSINRDLQQKRIDLINRFRPTLMTDLDDMFENIERQTLLRSDAHPEANNEYTKIIDKLYKQYDESKVRLEEMKDEQEQLAIEQFNQGLDEFIEREVKRLRHEYTEENYEHLVDERVDEFEQEKLDELNDELDKRITSVEVQAENKYFDISETVVPRVLKSNHSWLDVERNKYSDEIDKALTGFYTTFDSKVDRMNERITDIIMDYNTSSLLRKQEIEDEVKKRTAEHERLLAENEKLEKMNEERLKEFEKYHEQSQFIKESIDELKSSQTEIQSISKQDREKLRYELSEYVPELLDEDGNVIKPRSVKHMNEIERQIGKVSDKLSYTTLGAVIGVLGVSLVLFFVGRTQTNKTTEQIQRQEERHEEQMELQTQRLDELENIVLFADQAVTEGSLEDLEVGEPVIVEQDGTETEMTVTEITEDGRVIVTDENDEEFELVE